MKTLKSTFVLSAFLLLTSLCCKAQIYWAGISAGGLTYVDLCTIRFPFPPHGFRLTALHEHASFYPSSLEVECGLDEFTVHLDSVSAKNNRSGENTSAKKVSGDLARFVMGCVTNRGGQVVTNSVSSIQASWFHQSRTNQDITVLYGNHFTEVQEILERAYGEPYAGIKPVSTGANVRSLTYAPEQIGIALNLTGSRAVTVVSIINSELESKQK